MTTNPNPNPMPSDIVALDNAIRLQRVTLHSFAQDLEHVVMHPDGVPLRAPLHQSLATMYKLIDLLSLGHELIKHRPEVDSLGDIPREDIPIAIRTLSKTIAISEAHLKVNRAFLLGDAI